MNIGPVTNHPAAVSVAEPITPAYERVKQMLFRPFDLARWVTLGFCAWLAGLGESGGFSGNYGGGNNHHFDHNGQPLDEFRHLYAEASSYVLGNLYWIIPAAMFLITFCLALWVVLLWLNSRGKFMFLHCVSRNVAEVQKPWNQYAAQANSLFRFQLCLGLASLLLILPAMVFTVILGVQMALSGVPVLAKILMMAALILGAILLALIFAIVKKFLHDFVVPIQFLRNQSCLNAWREFWELLKIHPGQFALYLLFQIVMAIAIGTIVILAILLTCCLAGCLMVIPFIGTVLLLPVLIFKRSYSLYYLAQYGPNYDVFPPPAPAAPTTPLPNA